MLSGVFKPRTGRTASVHAGPPPAGDDSAVDLSEPRLDEILADPLVRLLMDSDRVADSALRDLLAQARAQLALRRMQ